MKKTGLHRGVTWTATSADAPGTGPSRRRWLHSVGEWRRGTTSAASFVRAGGIILLASVVFVALLGSIDRVGDPASDAVRMPNIVKTTRAVMEPATEPARPHETKPAAWWAMAADLPQAFAPVDVDQPAELCRRLAGLGYTRARWSRSEVFKDEWECSSPWDAGQTGNRSFALVRGAGANDLNSLMLKLTAPNENERAALIEAAGNAVSAFSQASRLVLSRDALSILAEWRTGRTWTSRGTFTIAAEPGREATRVVSLTATPFLPRPDVSDCNEACRERFRFLAKQAIEARRVRAEPSGGVPQSRGEPAGIGALFGTRP